MEEVRDLHQLSIGILGGDHLVSSLEGDGGRVESPGSGTITPP